MMFERLFRQKRTRIELDLTDSQIVKLRSLMDSLPIASYHDLILPVLKALPMNIESDAGTPSGADADRQARAPHGPVGGFRLTAVTSRGEAVLPEIQRVLNRLPHGGGGSL